MQKWRFQNSIYLLAAALALTGPACKKKSASNTPRPPIVVPNRTEAPKEVPLPPAPKITTTTRVPDKPPVSVVVTAPPPEPQPVKKAPTRRSRRGTKKAAEVKVAEAPKAEGAKVEGQAEEAKPAQAVKLGVILPPEQTRELQKRLEESLERTRTAVVTIEGKLLTKEQTDALGRIRSFLAQAEQTREEDLAGSVSLAERADLLSRDLLERLR